MSNIGQRLQLIRGDRSPKEMQERLGGQFWHWSGYEDNNRLPKPSVLVALIEDGYSIDWLVSGHGSMRRNDPLLPYRSDMRIEAVRATLRSIFGEISRMRPDTLDRDRGQILDHLNGALFQLRDMLATLVGKRED